METQAIHPINQALLDDGWRTFPSAFRNEKKQGYAKSFDGHAECKCNQRKRKQVEIYHHPLEYFQGHTFKENWSVECTGQLPDNEWLRMQVEGLTDLPTIQRTVIMLLSVWDHAVSISPYIEDES